MPAAAILCTQCGSASAPPLLSQCAKCGGKNARVCGGCGFQNSLAKNYCDKCGNPISELGPVVAPPPPTAPPGAPEIPIPATAVKNLKKDDPAPAALPAAKLKAAEPGALHWKMPTPSLATGAKRPGGIAGADSRAGSLAPKAVSEKPSPSLR